METENTNNLRILIESTNGMHSINLECIGKPNLLIYALIEAFGIDRNFYELIKSAVIQYAVEIIDEQLGSAQDNNKVKKFFSVN